MAKKLDKLVVIDVESTCWEKNPPPNQNNEIIEIGVTIVSLDNLSIEESADMIVRPHGSKVSEFCTSLTTLTQEMVDEGISFSDACETLREQYRSQERTWASWGDYDRRQFERQCSRKEFSATKYPFGVSHLNMKNLFALALGLDHEVGMSKALEMLNMDLEGTHHRAVDDARNIAKIACEILERNRQKIPELLLTDHYQ